MTEPQPTIQHINGFRAAGVHCGLKKEGKLDFGLIVSETPCVAAGVFTTNAVKAAPVLVNMERLEDNADRIRAVAINTGSANACTGQQGIENAHATARHVADRLGCDENEVLVLSTGVIGTQLPMDKIRHGVDLAVEALDDDWESAARAIMTTDTRPKLASLTAASDTGLYQIAGVSKGAGMIAPNMATMLGVIVTDAVLTPQQAQETLKSAADVSYNRIVVDGDMSTNDTVLLLANGTSGVVHEDFGMPLEDVCFKLAQDIVRDGEGATKFITINVVGAPDDAAARQIANTIATSPLVKTAFYGGDANWGRILAAAGRAGVPFEPEQVQLWIEPGDDFDAARKPSAEPILLFRNGMRTDYSEEAASAIMRGSSVRVLLECNQGSGVAVVWTCDLSHEYVSINADYRT